MKREIPPTGILKPWVAELGLRHQGVLVSIIRGCDTAPREDVSKALTRAIRGVLLNTHCADETKAKSYIEVLTPLAIYERMCVFLKSYDQYPHHWVMHLIHSCEIIGYKHPEVGMAWAFEWFYRECCRKFHMTPERERELDARLNADEDTFAKGQ